MTVPVAEWLGRRIAEPGVYDQARDREFPIVGKAPRAARFDGRQRHAVAIGTDPVGRQAPPLTEFLTDTQGQVLLSLKATSGFLSRTRRAKLRFESGFIAAVEQHEACMRQREGVSNQPELELLAA